MKDNSDKENPHVGPVFLLATIAGLHSVVSGMAAGYSSPSGPGELMEAGRIYADQNDSLAALS